MPNADRFAPLAPVNAAVWTQFSTWNQPFFSGHLGIVLEEVRSDYARMRLPFRKELAQPAGVMHGGAITTLIDTVVVPAVGSAYAEFRALFTIDLQVQFLDPIANEDAVAEGGGEARALDGLLPRRGPDGGTRARSRRHVGLQGRLAAAARPGHVTQAR